MRHGPDRFQVARGRQIPGAAADRFFRAAILPSRAEIWRSVLRARIAAAGFAWAGITALAAIAAPAAAQTWTLDRVLEAARRQEPGVLAARAAGEAGRAEGAGSVGALSPRLSAHGGFLRTDDPAMLFSEKLQQGRFATEDFAIDRLNYPSAASAFSWGLTLEQPLWNGGQEWTGPAHGGHLRSAATAGEQARVADRLLYVVQAYVAAVSAHRAVTADSIALTAAEENAHAAAARYRMGQVSELDSLRATARRAEAQASLLDWRKELAVALTRLSQIAGSAVAGTDLAEPDAGALSEPAGAGTAGHPDARQAEERAAAAEIDSRRATYRLLPSLNTRAALDYYHDPGSGATEHRWAVGVAVDLPIWDGTRRLQDSRSARARARQAHAEADALKHELDTQAEAARREREISAEKRDAARTRRQAAEAALALAQQRYQAGLLPWSELVSAEADAARARQEEVGAEAGVVVAYYRHLHAIGELK